MHILGIEGKNNSKGILAFWVFETIEYVIFTLGTYNLWSVKIVYNDNGLQNIRDNL